MIVITVSCVPRRACSKINLLARKANGLSMLIEQHFSISQTLIFKDKVLVFFVCVQITLVDWAKCGGLEVILTILLCDVEERLISTPAMLLNVSPISFTETNFNSLSSYSS